MNSESAVIDIAVNDGKIWDSGVDPHYWKIILTLNADSDCGIVGRKLFVSAS